MNTNKISCLKALDALVESLGTSEGQSTEEIKEELRSDGIDVDGILIRLKAAQKNISMASRRSVLDNAQKKRLAFIEKGRSLVGQFTDWTREQLIDRIREIGAAGAGFAYRDLEDISTESLASILEDLETVNTNSSQDDEG